MPVSVHLQDFNQVEQALLSPESAFAANEGGLNVVLARPEDLITAADAYGTERARQLLAAMDEFTSRGGGLVVSSLPPAVSAFDAGDPAATDRTLSRSLSNSAPPPKHIRLSLAIDDRLPQTP